MAKQKELFDGFLRLRNCRKCDRKLHTDHQNLYATREAGLCYACLREFEVSPFWTVDKFIEESKLNTPPVIVMECKLGRALTDAEVVHHINEVKNDNRPENLELMTASAHTKHHHEERRKRRLGQSNE